MIKILGAGLSGLTAGINLAIAEKEVKIFEQKNAVGDHIYPNYQGLLRTKNNPMEYLKKINLEPEFKINTLSKAILCTRNNEVKVITKDAVPFVLRGGKESLEYGLYKQAEKLGVEFEFNSKIKDTEVDIVSTGHYRCDMAAFAGIFEGVNFPDDEYLYMHDDRYSPRGWYLYILPISKGKIKLVNCTSQPYVKQTKKLFYKAISEKKILKEIIGDVKPIKTFGGYGGVDFPKSAVKNGIFYIGEAAGFQDPFRGFGMNYAIESGYLVAQAILNNQNYDNLWKNQFNHQKKMDFARRYAMVKWGDKIVEKYFSKYKDGQIVDLNKINPKGFKGKILEELFYRLELFHKWRTGYW